MLFLFFAFSLEIQRWGDADRIGQNILGGFNDYGLINFHDLHQNPYSTWTKKVADNRDKAIAMETFLKRQYDPKSYESAIMLAEQEDFSFSLPFLSNFRSEDNETNDFPLIFVPEETNNVNPQELNVNYKENEHPISVKYNKHFNPEGQNYYDDDNLPNKENFPLFEKRPKLQKILIESSDIHDESHHLGKEKYIPGSKTFIPLIQTNPEIKNSMNSHSPGNPISTIFKGIYRSITNNLIFIFGFIAISVVSFHYISTMKSNIEKKDVPIDIEKPHEISLNSKFIDELYQMIQLFKKNNIGSIIDELNIPPNINEIGINSLKKFYNEDFYVPSNCDLIIVIRNLLEHNMLQENQLEYYCSLFDGLIQHSYDWFTKNKEIYDKCLGPDGIEYLESLPKKSPKRFKRRK